MNRGFDATALARSYAVLDRCPERLLDDVIVLPIGDLRERVRGVCAWREALLGGRLPSIGAWPPAGIAEPALQALDGMGIARFCKDQPELVDALLKDVLASFARQDETISAEVRQRLRERLRELEELERKRLLREREEREKLEQLADKLSTRPRRPKRRAEPAHPDDAARQRLREQARREVLGRPRAADAGLIEAWQERARLWAEITDVFGDLGWMLGRGWDLTQGVLRHTGWHEVLRLRELVSRLPQLREIVRSLGRLHASERAESVAERVFLPMRRLEQERREVRTPLVPADTRGVERSDSVARMLPVEAAMLGHPKLRLLWHARRAERALLTYRVEGVEIETTPVEREATEDSRRRRPVLERGPILAVIDTSGSMHGLPEQVAKALVLEALCTAHAEKRCCLLHAFSGPGQMREHELDLSPEGIGKLLDFLDLSFHGGSDPGPAMDRVLQRLRGGEDGAWAKADILFASDGEWPDPTPEQQEEVRRAREAGTRFHGIQIGNRGRTGLHAVCEPVHTFTDWADVAGEAP